MSAQGPQSLDALIAATAQGDEKAFERLYRLSVDTLYGIALRILRRQDWAEEVVQESFVSVWRHAARFDRNKGAPMTWMIRIVRNQSFDWIAPSRADGQERAHGVNFDALAEMDLNPMPELAGGNAQDAFEQQQNASQVGGCLDALEPRQRQSIRLVFFNGLSHSELASHLHQPLGTVKAWVRRGLRALGNCLSREHSRSA